MSMVSFCTLWPLKRQKIKGLLMSPGVTERDQWYEMGLMFGNKTLKYGVRLSSSSFQFAKQELMIQS